MAEHRPTDEQLRDWLEEGGFPAYWTEEHGQYLDAMFAELLAVRAYVTDHETRCNTLCPRCGDDIGTNADLVDVVVNTQARVAELEAEQRAIAEIANTTMPSHRGDRIAAVAAMSNRIGELMGTEERLRAELEAAQREPIGFAVTVASGGGRCVQTAPLLRLDEAEVRARFYIDADARVVELREVGER